MSKEVIPCVGALTAVEDTVAGGEKSWESILAGACL